MLAATPFAWRGGGRRLSIVVPPANVLASYAMLRDFPTEVRVPFQALADDSIGAEARLTLAVLYAYAEEDGVVDMTPALLEAPRDLHRNTIRRQIYELIEAGFVVQINRATSVEIPQRRKIDGYMLTLAPDGSEWRGASDAKTPLGDAWKRSERWD